MSILLERETNLQIKFIFEIYLLLPSIIYITSIVFKHRNHDTCYNVDI